MGKRGEIGTLLTSWTNSDMGEPEEGQSTAMPRQARLDSPGTLHHVMIRGIEKRRIVDDDTDRGDFVGRLGNLAKETGTPIYAWALMTRPPVALQRGIGISEIHATIVNRYAVSYNLRHQRHGPLFQGRYKSLVCDGDSYFTELVRYIHLNPLRVQLVKDRRTTKGGWDAVDYMDKLG